MKNNVKNVNILFSAHIAQLVQHVHGKDWVVIINSTNSILGNLLKKQTLCGPIHYQKDFSYRAI